MNAEKLLFALFLAVFSLKGTAGEQWIPSTYPNPTTGEGYKLCQRPSKSFVCDPDSVISRESANVIEGVLSDIRKAVDPYGSAGCTTQEIDYQGFEVTVALMEKLQTSHPSPQESAQKFAVELFNLWGVGDASCQNGVLLLLSRQDRQVFIFAGKHALEVAPEGRLKQVIDRMRPLLRAGDYDQALEQAVVDLGLVLAGGEPQQEGEGSFWGLGIFLSIFAGIVGFTSWKGWRQKRDQRKVISLLEKLKKEQRQALNTGKYPAASCPICFEDFEDSKPSAPPLPKPAEESKTSRLENKAEAEASAPLLNPLAQQSKEKRSNVSPPAQEKAGKRRLALPCGHTFCEPCITSWLESHTTCPVCRKSMGSDGGDDDSGPGPSHRRPPPPSTDEDCGRASSRQADLYQDELQFRMMGLHRMYPWYVTTNMVNHASDMARRGEAFNFEAVRQEQMAQIARERHMHQGQYGSGSVGFGGGSSTGGGGVGGSW